MRRINEILAVVILSLLAVLLAALGLRYFDTYVTLREQKKILSRNQEANDRVQEMQQEIQELSRDREKLEQFLEEIQTGYAVAEEAEVVPVTAMLDEEWESPSENATVSGDESWSENATVSGNESWSENTTVSGDESWSENATVSGNESWSENATVSGNESWSENTTVSGNDTMSGNTLEERRQIRSSLEETLLINRKDRSLLTRQQPDFSGKKIACLGDSITAAANLEEQENYPDCSYPFILKELLGAEEVYNLGIGGSSIGRYWADAFVDRYQEIPEDTDIILVMGGTNDGFCLSEDELGTFEEREPWTFCGDLDELMRGLRENYPAAEIYFITPLPNILQDYLMREREYLLPQKALVDMMLELSEEYGFTVIDLYNSNMLDSHDLDILTDYIPDGVHPNEEGYQILAEHIAAELVYNKKAEQPERGRGRENEHMDFLDKLGDTISTKGKEMSGKAKDLAEIASLKRQISTCEDVIRKNYIEIGKQYYESCGQEPGAEYEEFCRAISNANNGIKELEQKIKEVKGI